MRIFTLLIALLAITTSLYSQASFRQYYGEPYAYANEDGFSIEKMGDRSVLIGTRESRISRSEDIALWFFDPNTLELTDSITIPAPDDQRLLDTYAGPDGGVLIIFEHSGVGIGNDLELIYFGPDGNQAWAQSITDEVPDLDFELIRDVAFKSSTELLLTFQTFGSGDELASRILNFTAADGLGDGFFFGAAGADDVWSIEYQPNGDILL
ncbi:MAG: hypothetical protein AAF840_07640, partial [Bacteroidota bacterium]